jgi:DNA-binding NtrC family response regulator
MRAPRILLLTNDPKLEDSVAQILRQSGGLGYLAESADDAMQIVCGVGQVLDLAVIDFESGPHGMTLLAAINACREHLPVIVVTHNDEKHVEALAYANGAAACWSKPISSARLTAALNQCNHERYQSALVA